MTRFKILNAAVWGCAIGCLCMAMLILYSGRAREVPVAGYVIDLLGGAAVGAGVFSLLAWILNRVASAR